MESSQPNVWNDWYRLASETLGYEHEEAVDYANHRLVEEQNRALLRLRPSPAR